MQIWTTDVVQVGSAHVGEIAQARLEALRRCEENPASALAQALGRWSGAVLSGQTPTGAFVASLAVTLTAGCSLLGEELYPDAADGRTSLRLGQLARPALWITEVQYRSWRPDPGHRTGWIMAPGTTLDEGHALQRWRADIQAVTERICVAGHAELLWRAARGLERETAVLHSGALAPSSLELQFDRIFADAPTRWVLSRFEALLDLQPNWKASHGAEDWRAAAWSPQLIRRWEDRLAVAQRRHQRHEGDETLVDLARQALEARAAHRPEVQTEMDWD